MSKTALQELIEFCKIEAGFINDEDSKEDKYARSAYKSVMQKAQSLLPKEKEIIKDAFSDGWTDGERYNASISVNHETSEDYFTNTFNQ